ncbi:hypothetical protein [Streptomyces sp. NPDC088923]|uniref:LppU/SCO3897 family protein n=1 Tax=Streptomyces sp. NPDC088923 TaxID=3365913 RepID=UPI00381B5532
MTTPPPPPTGPVPGNPYASPAPPPLPHAGPPAAPRPAPYALPHPVPGGLPAASTAPTGCVACGAAPAVDVTIRGHQGFLFFPRFLREDGHLCRDCGIGLVRHMSARTLWQGWWGIVSLVAAPVTLVMNAVTRRRLGELAAPTGATRPGMPLGKPLLRRPTALLLLTPAALLCAVLYSQSIDDSPGSAQAGDCVHLDNGPLAADPGARVVSCDSAEATYEVSERHGAPDARCAPAKGSSPLAYSETGLAGFTLCLHTHDTGTAPAPGLPG